MSAKTGGPAFPQALVSTEGGSGIVSSDEMRVGGMTLRDYFAAKAMAFLVPLRASHQTPWSELAKSAYEMADEMLKAREQ